ncbi:MAG: hypothetical protein R2795_15520 [Saprospiraceae bacterium]
MKKNSIWKALCALLVLTVISCEKDFLTNRDTALETASENQENLYSVEDVQRIFAEKKYQISWKKEEDAKLIYSVGQHTDKIYAIGYVAEGYGELRDIMADVDFSAPEWTSLEQHLVDVIINGSKENEIIERMGVLPNFVAKIHDFATIEALVNNERVRYVAPLNDYFYFPPGMNGQGMGEFPQILDSMFFAPQTTLRHEFQNLYAALFKNSAHHRAVVGALSKKSKGLTRAEIIAATQINSGGALTMTIRELIECGLSNRFSLFTRQKKSPSSA